MRLLLILVVSLFGGLAGQCAAETAPPPAYMDDRSDAGALVRSLYNAVNRHEYARAWNYFANAPAKDFDAYVKGYADTVYVDVFTGRIASEGAAGSSYEMVPVAIRATDSKGETKMFAGCYTVKAVNAQIQDPPFRPLLIEKAKLQAKDDVWLSTAAPDWCGEGDVPKQTAEEEKAAVEALFAETHRESCNHLQDTSTADGGGHAEVFELRYRDRGAAADAEERLTRLYAFECSSYAYNFSQVYYWANDYGEITLVNFPEPNFDIKYADDTNAKLESLNLQGFKASEVLINSSYDPASLSIASFSKWRGIGDASSSGTWVFRNGEFVLWNYELDPTYDDETNPLTVFADGQPKNP